jgi:Zn-dependent M28 family amino/carboxypeptidase
MLPLINFFISEYMPTRREYDVELAAELETRVRRYAFLRHLHLNPAENAIAREMILDDLKPYCDYVVFQGQDKNVVAGWGEFSNATKLVGGHYDGPPNSPGADDNGSAIASLISLAKQLSHAKPKDVALVAFNGEEVGFTGSKQFVAEHGEQIREAIILEMVGYFTSESGTQRMPEGLPEYDKGDFLGIVSNRYSRNIGAKLLAAAKRNDLSLPLKSLKIPLGLENRLTGLAHVKRSDHSPFWEIKTPAVMLTDTAEFRNQNYHRNSDTPETLNYPLMAEVVKLLRYYFEPAGH